MEIEIEIEIEMEIEVEVEIEIYPQHNNAPSSKQQSI